MFPAPIWRTFRIPQVAQGLCLPEDGLRFYPDLVEGQHIKALAGVVQVLQLPFQNRTESAVAGQCGAQQT